MAGCARNWFPIRLRCDRLVHAVRTWANRGPALQPLRPSLQYSKDSSTKESATLDPMNPSSTVFTSSGQRYLA
eukprot:2488393-Rhodomonas_salina.1